MFDRVPPIIKAILEGNNNPPTDFYIFDSNDHIRYQNGIDISGHNYDCHRTIDIRKNINGGEGYTVTIFNWDDILPSWTMAPKQMKIIMQKDGIVSLQGFGWDIMGGDFSDYAIDLYFIEKEVSKIVLKLLDRNIELEYFGKEKKTYYSLNADSLWRINNIVNNFRNYPAYASYQIESYLYDDQKGTHALEISRNGEMVSLWLFSPNPRGAIGSIAVYGSELEGHLNSIRSSMTVFGMEVSSVEMNSEIPKFINIELTPY